MDRSRLHELEERDLGLERGAIRALHFEGTRHRSEGCGERTARGVLECLAGLEYGLFSDDPRSVHFLGMSRAVNDRPMPVEELDSGLPFIGDTDRVEEEPAAGRWIAVCSGEISHDIDAHALGDGGRRRLEGFGITHATESSIRRGNFVASVAS